MKVRTLPPLFAALAIAVTVPACSTIRPPRGARPVEMTLTTTGYCRCGDCCGWERNWYGRPVYSYGKMKGKPKKVGFTASGTRARRGTVAADRTKFPFGTVVYVKGYGYGRVEDRGGGIRGDHIDLYFGSHRQAVKWGKKRVRVKVWFAKQGGPPA